MTCPICGCKMPNKTMCIYCKITGDQVENASNKKAKERIKNHDRKEVYYSTTMPKDVNRTKLLLLTLLLGYLGIGNYYVGRYVKGLYSTLSWVIYLPFGITNAVLNGKVPAFKLLSEIFAVFVMIAIVLWVADTIAVIAKIYKMPVVLGEKKKK